MWVVRMLGPANPMWKPLLDHYLLDPSSSHRREEILTTTPTKVLLARLLSSEGDSVKARLANSHPVLHFWRAAVRAFRKLEWREHTHLRLGHRVLATSIFSSPHFPPPSLHSKLTSRWWQRCCGIQHVRDLWEPRDE